MTRPHPPRARPRALLRYALMLGLGVLVGRLLATRGGDPFDVEPVRWGSPEAGIHGSLYLPRRDGPHAACVLIPGYGDWTRADDLFREHAERLAAKGTALLIYDKRGCGASGGDWRTARLAELAQDALGAHALLREHPEIDAGRVGLIGTSQGALVAALAAAREPDVAFVAALSPSTRSPAEHDRFLAGERVRRAGFPGYDAHRAETLHTGFVIALREGREAELLELDEETLTNRLLRLASEGNEGLPRTPGWIEAAQLTLWPPDLARWRAYRDLPFDLDAEAAFANVEVPLFAAQGGADWVVPGSRGHAAFQEIRARHGRDFTLVLIPDAEHGLRRRVGHGPLERWVWPEEYWRELEAWLARVTG